jgi:drug/metabolite transporter (DMT)-like permease
VGVPRAGDSLTGRMPGTSPATRPLDPHARFRAGAWLAVVAAAAFSTLAIFGRLAVDGGMRANTLLQWRFGVAAVVLAASGHLAGRLGTRRRLVLLAGGILYTLQTSLYFAALARITAGTTAFLLYLAPSFVILYAWVLGRPPTRQRLVAVALATAGLLVIAGVPGEADRSATGIALGLAAGATYAAYLLAGELLMAGVPPLTIAAHSSAGAALGFVALDLAGGRGLEAPAGAREWLLVGAVVLIPTLLAIPAVFAAIDRIGAAPTAIITTLEPVFTALLAWAVLAERIRPAQALGGLLILAGAVLAQARPRGPVAGRRAGPP